MSDDSIPYPGEELDVFADADNWRSYWTSHVAPFIKGDVLEVGAGIGSATRVLLGAGVSSWTALEPDPALASRLQTVAAQLSPRARVEQATLSSSSLVREQSPFDAIMYIDVVEHIDADATEIAQAGALLRPGGHLIVLVPAHESLYSPFDASIGHFRRYSKRTLVRLTPPNLNLVSVHYLDVAGLLASLANRWLLRSGSPTVDQVRVWDRGLVPLSRRLDRLVGYRLGKSLLAIWESPLEP